MISHKLFAFVRLVVFDFDGVFTDNTVWLTQDGIESVRCWRSDGLGLALLRESGVKVFILSTETNSVVSKRAEKLKLPCRQSVEDKAAAIVDICRELNILPQHTMFVGNDINDIPAFQIIGFPVAVADAYPEIVPYVKYCTTRPGGFGAVRDVCDLIVNAQKCLNEPNETHQ